MDAHGWNYERESDEDPYRQRLHCIYKLVERRMEKKEREKGKNGQNEDESINMT